ncbi:MAG: MFS transporter [Aestuariivirga sp.]|uniref:MFS transporter n=1 Tax=Aestuariivirga sp. TaxID=2650926 RepID=UPI0030160DA0
MNSRKLAAALMTCLCFGSIHAYGVLLSPVEQWLGTSRTVASMGYAVAIAALTLGVYLNGRIEAVFGPRLRLIGSGAVAALGLMIAGGSSSSAGLLLGFGVMYGLANGFAYAMSLGIAAAAMPGREAQAMGLATAIYGLGAVLCAQLFSAALGGMHVAIIFLVLAPVVFAICAMGAALIQRDAPVSPPSVEGVPQVIPRSLRFLWFSYLLGAFSGLMVLAHAPAIAVWRNEVGTEAGLVSSVVSLGSVLGGYLGGVFAAQVPGPRGIALPLLVQAIVLLGIPFAAGILPVTASLGLAGVCYGVLIAVIPVEVRRIFGPQGFALNYGKVFTAWGIAGVAGPVAAGYLYDITRGYGAALATAAVLSLWSCFTILRVGK